MSLSLNKRITWVGKSATMPVVYLQLRIDKDVKSTLKMISTLSSSSSRRHSSSSSRQLQQNYNYVNFLCPQLQQNYNYVKFTTTIYVQQLCQLHNFKTMNYVNFTMHNYFLHHKYVQLHDFNYNYVNFTTSTTTMST